MAHKKAGGSTKNGRDSESKRLGVKKYGSEFDFILKTRHNKQLSSELGVCLYQEERNKNNILPFLYLSLNVSI